MRNFTFEATMTSLKKIVYDVCFLTYFYNFLKKRLMLFNLLAITLSPLELALFNSMLALIAIKFYLLLHASSCLMTLQRMNIKIFSVLKKKL